MFWNWFRLVVPVLVVVLLLGTGVFLVSLLNSTWTTRQSTLTISDIRSVAQLVTVRAPVSGVQITDHSNWVGGIRLLVALVGEVEVGVDLEHAELESVDNSAHTAVLVLPHPAVINVHLDLQRSQIYSVDRSWLWHLVPGNDLERQAFNRAMSQAQTDLARYDGAGLHQQARQRAEELLVGAAQTLRWTVQVRWKDK